MSRHVVVMKLPVAHSFGLLNYPNSFCRGMFNLNAKYDADPLLYLLSHFNTVATCQYSCSLNGIYHPHWLIQWSLHCSHRWNVTETVLVIVAMAGLFLDRPHIHHWLILKRILLNKRNQSQKLHTAWFHLYCILEKINLCYWRVHKSFRV